MEPTIYKPSIYNGAGIYKAVAEGGGGGTKNFNLIDSLQFHVGVHNNTINFRNSGKFNLLVIAVNNEASDYQNNIYYQLPNASEEEAETIAYNAYNSTPENKRNYRISRKSIECVAGDLLEIRVKNTGSFTNCLAFVFDENFYVTTLKKALSVPDDNCIGSYNQDSKLAVCSYIDATALNNRVLLSAYKKDTTLCASSFSSSYCTGFIFWLD